MGKTFDEWIGERRKVVELPSGIEAEVRRPSGIKVAAMGPLPGVGGAGEMTPERQGEISRRYVEACLVRLAGETDPIGRGLITAHDFTLEDIEAIVDAVIELLGARKAGEGDGAVPLAPTASPSPPPG